MEETEHEKKKCQNITCTNEKKSRCSACKVAVYCSVACQKKDWTRHKHFCKDKKAVVARVAVPQELYDGLMQDVMKNGKAFVYDKYDMPEEVILKDGNLYEVNTGRMIVSLDGITKDIAAGRGKLEFGSNYGKLSLECGLPINSNEIFSPQYKLFHNERTGKYYTYETATDKFIESDSRDAADANILIMISEAGSIHISSQ